jgi:hypothetical protein
MNEPRFHTGDALGVASAAIQTRNFYWLPKGENLKIPDDAFGTR